MEQMETGKVPSNVQEIPPRGETFRSARDKLSETWSGVNEYAREAAGQADEAVRANPWTSVGIGFGAGVIIGALIALAASSRSR